MACLGLANSADPLLHRDITDRVSNGGFSDERIINPELFHDVR